MELVSKKSRQDSFYLNYEELKQPSSATRDVTASTVFILTMRN